MNRALLAKELRALRPFVWCILGLWLISTAYLFATGMPDAQPFNASTWQADRDSKFGLILALSLMVGATLLTGESDSGTLTFLDGLPLSRTRLFLAKLTAALLVASLIPIIDTFSDVALGWLSSTSLDGRFPWRLAAICAGLEMVAAIYLLAWALIISFVRTWFIIVAGLLFWGYLWLIQAHAPGIDYLNPYTLLTPALASGRHHLAWIRIGAHLGLAVALIALAWVGFQHLGDGAQRLAQRASRGRWKRVVGGMTMFGPLVWLGALVYLASRSDPPSDGNTASPAGEEAFARRETKHYEFLFREMQRESAQPLLAAADRVFNEVAAHFKAPPSEDRIVVDLASPVPSHMAGLTNWTKIRLPLLPGDDLPWQKRVLGHETVHVLIEQIGAGKLSNHYGSIRSLHEGLATYLDESLFAPAAEAESHRRAVAAAWARGKVPFSLLVDDPALQRERDGNLVYPLGAELARAMIASDGPEAPARFLRAVARPTAAPSVKGIELWRDAMQAAGLNFERVMGSYESACAEIATAEKEFTNTLPRLTSEVSLKGSDIVIRPRFKGEAPGRITCAVEDPDPFSPGLRLLPRQRDGNFTLPRSADTKPKLRYLLGWQVSSVRLPIFEPWIESPIQPAKE